MRKASRSHPDAYSANAALRQMRMAVDAGRYNVHPRVFDRLFELGLAPTELRESLEAAFREITLADFKEPDTLFDPPGHGFVWNSTYFGCCMYLKFRLEGKRPVCWLYSLHRSDYEKA
jgi:hypothetical protein